jgi:membrane protein implicated in regulation of membrane protease activity
MSTLVWVVSLLVLGLGVMVLEVFVPSGGILGFVSILALVASVATAFLELGATAGMASLAVVVLAVPAVLSVAFRWFPETPLGRRVLPPAPESADVLPDPTRRQHARDLIGRTGLTVSELLPWGGVQIDGEVVDAVSEDGPIAAGVAIEVVGEQAAALIVRKPLATFPERPLDAPLTRPLTRIIPPTGPLPPGGQSSPAEHADGEPESALSSTLETFEFDAIGTDAISPGDTEEGDLGGGT